MTSKEYVIWLKGFVEACHEYAPTPKQWDALKDKLAEVKDETPIGFPFGVPNTTPMTTPLITPSPTYPYRPYEVYCGDTNGTTITTTPGGGSITYATPQFGVGSTSTAYGYPSGSTMSYTNSAWKPEHGPNSPTIQNINQSLGESLEELENDFFGAIDDGGWTPELEQQFWSEQPPEPFATSEELAKYNIDSEGFENQIKS
jgi:hypothetical protein